MTNILSPCHQQSKSADSRNVINSIRISFILCGAGHLMLHLLLNPIAAVQATIFNEVQ
jgi:hypothetical protein